MKYDRQKIADMRSAGFTYEQIAQELGTTKGNISSQISMMRKAGWNILTTNQWTDEDTKMLIQYRAEGKKLPEIAKLLNHKYDYVKKKASDLVKQGIIERGNNSAAPKSSVQELNQYVLNYVSRDNCPQPYLSRIIQHYGSWSAALEANGLSPNIGGKMNPNKPTIVYLLDFGAFKKIGITQRMINQRFSGAPSYTVLDTLETDLATALEFEKELKQAVANRAFQPSEPWFERNGRTECFIGQETELAALL